MRNIPILHVYMKGVTRLFAKASRLFARVSRYYAKNIIFFYQNDLNGLSYLQEDNVLDQYIYNA